MRPRRPPREAYLRLDLEWCGLHIVPGLELREQDHFGSLRTSLEGAVTMALRSAEWTVNSLPVLAHVVEIAVKDRFPDRAYFLEVGDQHDTWVQLWQPPAVEEELPLDTAPAPSHLPTITSREVQC